MYEADPKLRHSQCASLISHEQLSAGLLVDPKAPLRRGTNFDCCVVVGRPACRQRSMAVATLLKVRVVGTDFSSRVTRSVKYSHTHLSSHPQVEDCTLQLSPNGNYLDLDSSLAEQRDELEAFYQDVK